MSTPDTPSSTPSPRHRRTQAERTQLTQQKLVKGAIALLRQKRYAGFRIAEAAKVSGVSRGAQTHHFPSKDALVLQALEATLIESQRKALERIARARTKPTRLMQALIEDSEDFFLGEDFYVALDLMMVGGDQPLGVEVKRLLRQYRISVERAWLEVFVEAGHPAAQAEDVIFLTFAMARGLSVRKLMSGEAAHFPRLFSRWELLASDMLEPPPAPRRKAS
ncbi:MAG: TetR/AcrR family transcriptional regulator [Hydrogenophaga sp.]|jgi:AcrR family transcriptional regulator|uniref:TetR/AcrR family transcriptional regulator n=1 Tax=unclassified Hydrogenophaga TaxID=2610897 RepID=UPI0036D3DD66